MTDTAAAELRKTPLNARHRASNARMVEYAGWDMPVEYSGITAEHLAVRTRAGVFDVSHMGEIEIAGKNALAAVQRISSNDAAKLQMGQAQYAALLTPDGTFVDDMLVYRLGTNHFMLVVNAANMAKDYAWIVEQIKTVGDVAVVDTSSRYALIAVQGPAARDVLQPLTGVDLDDMPVLLVRATARWRRRRATISRTGYTGEDGFEIFVPPNVADRCGRRCSNPGARSRCRPVRPRRARHAAPRSGHASLRQRHRRVDHRARGRPGLDRRLEQAGLHRPRPPPRAEGRRTRRASWSGSR